MKKIRLIALLLAALLLAGCVPMEEPEAAEESYIHYRDMEYRHPDMQEMEQLLEDLRTAAEGDNPRVILNRIYAFYDAYDWFYTCYSLADLGYCADLTDPYWEEEYAYCMENSTAVEAMLEEMYYILAASPCRETLEGEKYFGTGYFDSYDGESIWDETFTALMEREAELENRYYTLVAGDGELPGQELAELLAELVGTRQELAAYLGYESYPQFAGDFYYYRDYTPDQMEAYLETIRQELVPLYREMEETELLSGSWLPSGEDATFRYVRQAAENMGGTVWEAFQLMENAGLYDISYGANKYPTSFELYLTSYEEPFVYICPQGTRYDWLVLAHEFGHFCNDYASYGSYADVDVTEIFSQGMEYLSLCYSEDVEELTRAKLADSLCIYVEQAAFAEFELGLYDLSGEELTAEGIIRLYEEVAQAYGLDIYGYDGLEFAEISHFYTNPMYIFSYVTSNDAAMQLYQLEQQEKGAGLALLEENLDTQEISFLAFLNSAGLESPFEPSRIQAVRETFEILIG